LVLLIEVAYEVCLEMVACGITYTPSFVKTGRGVQAILRFYLRNFRICNVGIANGKDL
jgi:hypothetical protein